MLRPQGLFDNCQRAFKERLLGVGVAALGLTAIVLVALVWISLRQANAAEAELAKLDGPRRARGAGNET